MIYNSSSSSSTAFPSTDSFDPDFALTLLTAPLDAFNYKDQYMFNPEAAHAFWDAHPFESAIDLDTSPELSDFELVPNAFSAASEQASPAFSTASQQQDGYRAWQYSNQPVNFSAANQSLLPFQNQMNCHRRALSNASSASYGSESPGSQHNYSQQYPSSNPTSQPQPAAWDGYNSANSPAGQHLPTPARTPESTSRIVRRATPLASKDSNMMNQRLQQFSQQPSTPQNMVNMQQQPQQVFPRNFPNLSRTTSASTACADELYMGGNYLPSMNPSAPAAAYQQHQQFHQSQQPQSIMAERLQAARASHMSPNPVGLSNPAAFPYGPGMNGAASYGASHYMTSFRQQAAAAAEAQVQHHQEIRHRDAFIQPQTVSPKDAFPKEPEPQEEQMSSLFPQEEMQSEDNEAANYGAPMSNAVFAAPSSAGFDFSSAIPDGSTTVPSFSQEDSSMRLGVPPQFQHEDSTMPVNVPSYPPRLVTMETTQSGGESSDDDDDEDVQDEEANVATPEIAARPQDTRANTGTYSCTYRGCSRRFPTETDLKRHKKDEHKHQTGQKAGADQGQAGPHKCERINPQTGKPCNTIFSRPYDLTRHEDTIHAHKRKQIRCPHCPENSTRLFSRGDALTRHLRIVHQGVPGSGTTKTKRRANV